MLLHVFRHINADKQVLIIKQLLSKSLGELSFTNTGRSKEQE
jgi:hypothetical protein